jgi:hypothetical protein
MVGIQKGKRAVSRSLLFVLMLLTAFGTFSIAQGKRYKSNGAWSFGVMADTQWTLGRPGYSPAVYGSAGTPGYVFMEEDNPSFISESIAKQVRQAMIKHKVKFTFQMGDSSNWPSIASHNKNATNVQELYSANIGYFPLRGNHETYGWMVGDFVTENGKQVFRSYDPDFNYNIPEFRAAWPQTQGIANLFGAANFSSPTRLIPFDSTGKYVDATYQDSEDLKGLSYSFDYGPASSNARFVIMDMESTGWVTPAGQSYPTAVSYAPAQQQEWISGRLKKSARGTVHAFVLAHRQPMGANHQESPFGSFDPNPFYKSLQDNDVKYYISGHDHMYHRSVVASPDLQSRVTQIISAGVSTKFYLPAALTQDQKLRELPLAQELSNVGYYVYTVDGPRVTVDYYSDRVGNLQSDYCYPYGVQGKGSCSQRKTGSSDSPQVMGTWITPTFNFAKKESFGYSLNGREFLVAQGGSYTAVHDSYDTTSAQILAGTNNSTTTDATSRAYTKPVNTGWTPKPSDERMKSHIFSLWGMSDFGGDQTETYVLSLSFDMTRDLYLQGGGTGIAALDANNAWVNAVNLNFGGTKNFVLGPYQAGYALGTYGIDYATKTAWAVLNYNADFVVINGIEDVPRRYWRIRE